MISSYACGRARRTSLTVTAGGLALALAGACGGNTDTPDGQGTPSTLSPDGGSASQGDGGAGGASDSGVGSPPPSSNDAAPGTPETCARADLTVTRTIPTVWLLVDGSGSMSDGFTGLGTASRWSVLREVLMDAGSGVVARLTNSVAFGLMVYDGGMSPPGIYVPGICPRVIVVPPAVGNLADIQTAYPQQPTGASTPTHHALEDLSMRIASAGPSSSGPTYVVLATDGKPNLCDFHDGIPASEATEQEAVTTVAELATRGTKSFAISMAAGNDAALQAHLDAVAQAGGTGQPTFTPTSKDALVDALSRIIGGTTSCEVTVEGSIVAGRECAGEVSLNDQKLACNDANGYRVKDDRKTIELVGSACDTLRGSPSAQIEASFACEDVILR